MAYFWKKPRQAEFMKNGKKEGERSVDLMRNSEKILSKQGSLYLLNNLTTFDVLRLLSPQIYFAHFFASAHFSRAVKMSAPMSGKIPIFEHRGFDLSSLSLFRFYHAQNVEPRAPK